MKFTDIFIKRPVLAMVVSLFIFILGFRAATELNVRQFPKLQNAVISVSTVYPGADSNLIQGFITTPLEREIASAEGIDYIDSTSVSSASSIRAYLRLDSKPDEVLTQVVAKVNKVRGDLPEDAEPPVVELSVGETIAAMYLSFYSDILDNNQITDYLTRVVEPKLATIAGVQRARVLGSNFAMRIWLEPEKMYAYNVTGREVMNALRANNVLSAVGATKSHMVSVDLSAETDLKTVENFQDLVIYQKNDTLVRLSDIATIEMGSENYSTSVTFNGKNATFIGIEVATDANALDVIKSVREAFQQDIAPQLPEGLSADIPYDSTRYIDDAIHEVIKTLVEAVVIVILVIYLFLGSVRSVMIPVIAVPLSLVGACFLMWSLGFTVNLLTLLAMVLAIGIVVDDAIIVLENIHRHIEAGMSPSKAALIGARELAWPVVAMTTTLIAVYLPIGFMGGLTGTLFREFAFTLAGSVLLSGVVALTLSPMMCAKLLKGGQHQVEENRLARWIDKQSNRLQAYYQNKLHRALNDKKVILIFSIIVLTACYLLFKMASHELEPKEDRGLILVSAEADPFTTLDYLERYTREINKAGENIPEVENIFLLNGIGGGGSSTVTNTAFAGFVLTPSSQRNRNTHDIQQESVQASVNGIAGLRIATFVPPTLPSGGGGGFPVEFVIGTTEPVENLENLSQQILKKAYESRKFIFTNSDLKIDKPKYTLSIDKKKAALLGIDMSQLSQDMSAMLSSGVSGRFSLANRSYKVIPQVQRIDRLSPEQLTQYHTRTQDGQLIALSTLVKLNASVEPQQLNRFQQLNSVTISGVPRPGVTLGEALSVLEDAAAEVLPSNYFVDYAGQSRQFKHEGQALILTFFLALVAIYLVLSAQFESFRDPLIMLVTVPMSICGAMIFVSLGLISLNIYTQVGLITLIGVISKHGILIVEFANKLQEQGRSKREAIEQASAIRLRPVLMTTAALVLAMVPLLLATGPGSGARFAIGLVIASGMTIGTLFTLFVVPAIYLYLGREIDTIKSKETLFQQNVSSEVLGSS